MTRGAKEQIENNIQLLEEAHAEVFKVLAGNELVFVLELLENCQAVAIQIGTVIENLEGEGFVTVAILEEYCEQIFRIHGYLSQKTHMDDKEFDATETNVVEIQAGLKALLTRVRESIQEDIKVRKEAVFLPYKAAMWDSLESVWMAADAESDCDAYVIPIPYFDKKPDGSFGVMHYEGNQYPKDIPITDYNTYNFELRRPDMIYIHNPYDEHNAVTSVHPFFYAKNLKQYTDCLVYIPYFVLDEIDPVNRAAVEGMEHFVTVSGVIHAHKVIVQSEEMRQVYIDVMSREAGEHTRPIWEQKILGTGSPKLDKLRRTKKEDLEVPEEWRRILTKEDGGAKKVILYNTSVSALLKYEEKMLSKIQRAFGIFRENQGEVALLWRPHPLMKATIEAMRPRLWQAYQEIVEQYKEEGWGIYDDTPDMDRAIALCDAYYGDGSSLVQLCKEAGKPVMVQNVEV